MLDARCLRDGFDAARAALSRRGAGDLLDKARDADAAWRKALGVVEALKAAKNDLSKQVGAFKKEGKDAAELIALGQRKGEEISALEGESKRLEADLADRMTWIPNLPHESVPDGNNDEAAREERRVGVPREFTFTPKPHHELGPERGLLDFEAASKLSGARFAVLKGAGAALHRALTQFMLDLHVKEHGYLEIAPPFLVTAETMRGTGQLPKFADESFKVDGQDFYLIPTAEVPVTNLHRGEILTESELPKKYVSWTPCFRSEAGSYGKDTKGMLRQHQFEKVELVHFVRPEDSFQALEQLTQHAETVLQKLELPYRVVTLPAGDFGFAAAKTYDIEVWLPGQGKYREISSCSNCTDFQARRASIRFRREATSKVEFLHTLNGSGLAVGRTWIAVVENNQNADGTITVPKALRPFLGSDTI